MRPDESARGLAQSKTCRLSFGYICFLLSALCFQASGQYSIDWSTIDGGGGTSTGGVYTISGTIGQPDAGTMSGGNYTLQGGFWGIIAAVQTPGAPWLTITRTATNSVVVSWANTGSYTLQTNNNLATSNWNNCGGTINTTNGTNSVTVTPPTGNLFFRLKQ